MGGDVTVYTLLSTCPVVNHYILTVYHLFSCYHLFFSRCLLLKVDPVYFLIQTLSMRLSYIYVCSQFNLSSKSLQTCFFVQGFSLLDFTWILSSKYYHAWTRPLYRSKVEAWRSGNPGCLFPMELPNPR